MTKHAEKLNSLTKEELISEIVSLRKKVSFGLKFENQIEDCAELLKTNSPFFLEDKSKILIKNKKYPTSVIIEGENLHSLDCLRQLYKKKIDLIYIDPPYNTGAKNWVYNNNYVDDEDSYRHSKWLSFMKKRLLIAKDLLRKNGSLVCAIDENEQAHLVCLIEDIFKNHDIHTIPIIHNPGGKGGNNFAYTHEYAIFVFPKKTANSKKLNFENRIIPEEERESAAFRNWGGESNRSDGKNTFYPVIIDKKTKEIIGFGDVCPENFHPSVNEHAKNSISIYPIDTKGVEKKWRYERASVEKIQENLEVIEKDGIYDIKLKKDNAVHKTVWTDKKYSAKDYGTRLLNEIIEGFDYPKSLWTVHDCIEPIVRNNKKAIILDFFAGSGTTGHALMHINKKDKGTRKAILCTANENFDNSLKNGVAEDICFKRLKKVIENDDIIFNKENISGYEHNLNYLKVDLMNRSRNDSFLKKYARKMVPIIKQSNQAFEKIFFDEDFQIYSGLESDLFISFNEIPFEKIPAKVNTNDKKKILYDFTYSDVESEPDEKLSNYFDEIINFPTRQIKTK